MARSKTHKDDDHRATVGAAHRQQPQAHPIVSADVDDTSPMQTIEERDIIRRRRGPSERIEHLEHKHDELANGHHGLALVVAELKGGVAELKDGVKQLLDYGVKSNQERERRAMADVLAEERRKAAEAAAAAAEAAAEAAAAEQARLNAIQDEDRAEKRRAARRAFMIALIGALATAAAVVIAAMAQGCL